MTDHPLADGFNISTGWVTCRVPYTAKPRNDYFVVLFGDSGNRYGVFLFRPGRKLSPAALLIVRQR